MKRNTRILLAALAAIVGLATTSVAAQRVTNNENTTNKTTSATASASRDSKSKKVNINTASKEELEALPAVGPVIADNIIAKRPFKTVKGLMDVEGIGEKRFQEILPHVTVGTNARRGSDTAAGGPPNASTGSASGSGKPTAEAQSANNTPPGSKSAGGVGSSVRADSTHSGSDKPGAREKEESRAPKNSKNKDQKKD